MDPTEDCVEIEEVIYDEPQEIYPHSEIELCGSVSCFHLLYNDLIDKLTWPPSNVTETTILKLF